jgi:hypothetical protein
MKNKKETRSVQVMTRITTKEDKKLTRDARRWGGTRSSYIQYLIQEAK